MASFASSARKHAWTKIYMEKAKRSEEEKGRRTYLGKAKKTKTRKQQNVQYFGNY